ncbi:MAG: decaprenyl-phosphate phosphoribosyltransferase [Dongiaceae bacterium]
MTPVWQLLRPQQWVKNAFVAAPLFFTPAAMSPGAAVKVLAGVAGFCAVSSGVYVLNDYLDRAADRRHPHKRDRPLAAGSVDARAALGLMGGLAVGGLAGAGLLSAGFTLIVAAYLALNVAYSAGLKRLAIIDVMSVALGFVLRVYAGGALIGVEPTVWIVACTMLLALFIALAKRRDDVVKGLDEEHRESLAGYSRRFLDTSLAVVLSALLVSYLLYTTQPENMARLGTDRLYLTVPFVIAGVLRYLQITLVEERSGAPTTVMLTDRFLLVTVFGWVAAFAWLIYG